MLTGAAPLSLRSRRMISVLVVMVTVLITAGTSLVQARGQAAPKSGGTLKVQQFAPISCLDVRRGGGTAFYVDQQVFDTLVEDNHGRPGPGLATKWKFSHGGKWITFTLRQARFSNGHLLDATTVKHAFDIFHTAGYEYPLSQLGPLQTMRVLSKSSIRFELKQAFRPLLTNLETIFFGIPDYRAKNHGVSCDAEVGTGPFAIQSTGAAFNTVTLVRNKYHDWESRDAVNRGLPYVAKLEFVTVPSPATAVSELLSGGLDYSSIDSTQLGRVTGNSSVKLVKSPLGTSNWLTLNLSRPTLQNLQVRKAIAMAIDPKAILKAAFSGTGKPARTVISTASPYYDKAAAKLLPSYNPTKAAQIFSANHVTGPLTLTTINCCNYPAVAEIIQAELLQAGVQLKINALDFASVLPAEQKGDFDLALLQSGGAADPDEYGNFSSTQLPPGGFNESFLNNPTVDKLLNQGRVVTKFKKLRTIYSQFQTLMNKNVYVVPLWSTYSVGGIRKKFAGLHLIGGQPIYQDIYLAK